MAFWTGVWITITAQALVLALVLTIRCRDQRRAFWLAFFAFCGGYELLCFGPWYEAQAAYHEGFHTGWTGPFLDPPVNPNVPSSQLLDLIWPYVRSDFIAPYYEYIRTAHLLLGLVLGWLGGVTAGAIYWVFANLRRCGR